MGDVLSKTRAVLSTTPQRWVDLVDSLPEELLSRPAAPGEWSALDCLRHMLDIEQYVFPARVRAFLSGVDFPAFNPDVEGTDRSKESPSEMAGEFARLRAENLLMLAQLTPAQLTLGAKHSQLGPVTLGQMVNNWAAHDLNHTVQAERAIMQPFIVGSGPWCVYFGDHDVRTRTS